MGKKKLDTPKELTKQEKKKLDLLEHYSEKDIKEINETTQKKQAALDNWDVEHVNKVLELENYWNFLQGHATTWAFNTKTEQKKFDKTKENALLTFNKRYGLSA